jgi:hypothetical protein
MSGLLVIAGAKRFAKRLRRKSNARRSDVEMGKKVSKRRGKAGQNSEDLKKKREEAERKARRGEIDPTHEFTFHLIGQV